MEFAIQQKSQNSQNWSDVATVDANEKDYTVTSLDDGETYDFRVRKST